VTVPSLLAALPGRLAPIIAGLRRALAERAAKDRALAPLVMLLWSRLNEVAKRFASRVRRADAGLVRRTVAGAPSVRRQGSVARASGPQLAGGFAWLVRLVPEAACCGGQLQHLLSDPEVAAALAAAPSAGRVLRPLCRMLGVDSAVTPPAARAPAPAAGEPPKRRRSKPERRADAGGTAAVRALRERVPRSLGRPWLRWRTAGVGS